MADQQPDLTRQQAAAGPVLADERATFEAWIAKAGGDLSKFGKGMHIHYSNSAVNNAWSGWQARASIPAAPALVTLPRPRGVARDAESPGGRGVLVFFDRTLSDDELRALHEGINGLTVDDGMGGNGND